MKKHHQNRASGFGMTLSRSPPMRSSSPPPAMTVRPTRPACKAVHGDRATAGWFRAAPK